MAKQSLNKSCLISTAIPKIAKMESILNANCIATEPAPAVTDCWAQGSVPKSVAPVTPRTPVLEEVPEEQEQIQETPEK